MKIHKSYIAVGMIIAFTLMFELAAHADESDQATQITFSQPIQVPGQILPAGTYLFQLLDDAELNTVQIFSPDRTHLYATLRTIQADSGQVHGGTTVELVEQGGGKPDVLRMWFYPGDDIGHEFVYPRGLEKQMAQDRQKTVVATDSEAGGSN